MTLSSSISQDTEQISWYSEQASNCRIYTFFSGSQPLSGPPKKFVSLQSDIQECWKQNIRSVKIRLHHAHSYQLGVCRCVWVGVLVIYVLLFTMFCTIFLCFSDRAS